MNKTIRLLTILGVALVVSCGSDAVTSGPDTTTTEQTTTSTSTPTTTSTDAPDPDSSATGVVTVRLEPVKGFFIEGFEIGLRFETGDGDTIDSMLWTDFVNLQGSPTIEDYYNSVLEQEVPAGTVVVFASANIGMGPGPQIPDVEGALRCRLELEIPEGGTVDVEVTFSDDVKCLRLLES